jgi:hypothetical protein
MDLEAIGYRAARGHEVDLENFAISEANVENALAEYEGALLHVFDAATGHKAADCTRAAQHLLSSAHTIVACCLLHTGDLDLRHEALQAAARIRDGLRVLAPVHWQRENILAALRGAGASEFRGRWASLVDVC